MNEFLVTVLASNALLLAILGYLFKSIISQWLSKEIERFKMDLSSTANAEIESYKSNLEKERIRLQVAYSGLYSRQADTILNLYNLLVKFQKELNLSNQFLEGGIGDEYLISATDSWAELHEFFQKNRILLPEDIITNIEKIETGIFNSSLQYRILSQQDLKGLEEAEIKKLLENKDKYAMVVNEFPAIKYMLEQRFREIIGVTINP